MSKNESRVERKKEKKSLEEKSKTSLNKVYYWIIGFLFFVLFLLILFIFSKSGDKVDVKDQEPTDEFVQEESTEDSNANQSSEAQVENEELEDAEVEENDEEVEEPAEEEGEVTVNEDAPYDSDHAIDFNGGSTDRIAIKEEIMKATGLDNNLIEYWVGNNGPGRVIATVANPDHSEIYEVKLQYGEGSWHVTNYTSLDSIPNNFD